MEDVTHRNTRLFGLLLACALALAAVPLASAHTNPNHGTIKVHDDRDVDPDRRNQPHVSCTFWIEGFDMSDDEGKLIFYQIPPTSNPPQQVMEVNWEADRGTDADGFHFLAGPFNFTTGPGTGHYRVEAFVESGHPGNQGHFSKAKTFWVNGCEPGMQAPPCPAITEVAAKQDGDVAIDWAAVPNADAYRVYRATGDGDLNSYAALDGDTTQFTDENTTAGTTYRYMVTAVVDGVESANCEEVQITAIPFFPSATAAAVALLGIAGIYVSARRRR